MQPSVAEMLNQLTSDPWRQAEGFSKEITEAQDKVFGRTEEEIIPVLNDWIGKFQPCLFGRIAARLNLISYCIISEADQLESDSFIQEKIQEARLRWLREALNGDKSGFVIALVSKSVAEAQPNSVVKELARKLCSLYLLENAEMDHIHLDAIDLDLPDRVANRWRWDVGVNYFCAQGDRRWWQDHRIPGGMALSMNSVGHMVKSGRLAGAMKVLSDTLATDSEGWRVPSLDTLDKALVYAMRTIANASEAVSGKATELLELPSEPNSLCVENSPITLPKDIADKNFCEYQGFYHTDFTLPSEYFIPDVTRPHQISSRKLDFSYLFDNRLSNPDYINMGRGRRVAAEGESSSERDDLTTADRSFKRGRSAGRIVREDF